MTRKTLFWAVAVAIAMIACIVWIQLRPITDDFDAQAASDKNRAERVERDPATTPGRLSEQQAARLSPRGWTPPAEFSQVGPATPAKPFRRGKNARRVYGDATRHEVDPSQADGEARALAGTPQDGRFHLLPEEIDLHTLIGRRMVFDPSALENVIAGESSQIIAPTTGEEVLTLDITSFKTRSSETHTLFGRVVGEETTSEVQLVYHDGIIHGTVSRHLL